MTLLHRILVALAPALLAGCVSLPPRPEMPAESALPAGETTVIDRAAMQAEARHPGQSAFRLVTEGTEAFAARAHAARIAGRSIDVQTYIWHADLTGNYLAHVLLQAADRGVRVRLLLDDLDARAKNAGIAALAAHPNIAVRLFNPFATRSGTLRKVSEGLGNFNRINRRMHNKAWIVDNRVAIAGGRNVGDEYFSAADEVNFVDLDFAMVGPVVRDVSASFDKYWNSAQVYPIQLLDPEGGTPAALEKLRTVLAGVAREAEASRYAKALAADNSIQRLISGQVSAEWSAKYTFVSDDPLKVTMSEHDAARSHVGALLAPTLAASERGATIISPYFVPGPRVSQALADKARSGKPVHILTNSLAANDVAAVHGGYSQYRETLVAGGVELWELKPLSGSAKSSLFGSSGASLHTKALSVDGRKLFVGSYNLDPRSTWLNCEQGVLVESEALAKQFESIFSTQASGERAWRVTLVDGRLSWSDGTETFDSDPKASAWRRFQAWLSRVLDLEPQL